MLSSSCLLDFAKKSTAPVVEKLDLFFLVSHSKFDKKVEEAS
jgi:hypothetical protein